MPHIRTVVNKGTPREQEEPLEISDVSTDRDGYLQFFTVRFSDGIVHMHLVRHAKLLELATGIFGSATSIRSAKGLLDDFNKIAGRERWKSGAGAVGMGIGSVMQLHEWLKTRPFSKEGYYKSNGELWLPRLIRTDNQNDYLP